MSSSACSELRPALGQVSHISLGGLYDAHSESILDRSLLKTKALPPECVEVKDAPGLSYKYTTTDTLEEKLKGLDVSAELGLSALCGWLKGSWCCEYLAKEKTGSRVRQASTICKASTKTEKLRLEEESLKDCLDLTALQARNATHVISSIEWGARTLITVKEYTANANTNSKIGGTLGGPRSSARKDSSTANTFSPVKESLVGRIAKCIGEVYAHGKVETENMNDSTTTSLDFEIAADVANWEAGGIPKSFDDVMKFLETIPSSIKNVNEGKGVPITFHLLPIEEVAKMFDVEVLNNTPVNLVDQDCLSRSIERLEELRTNTRNLEEYTTLVKKHEFCVPKRHTKQAKDGLDQAKDKEVSFKSRLYETIVGIRKGGKDTSDLRKVLSRDNTTPDVSADSSAEDSSSSDDENSLFNLYKGKMFFADLVREKGARYIGHKELDDAIAQNGTGDLYILYFNAAAQSKPSWPKERKTFMDLLDEPAGQHQLIVVDYDIPKPEDLEKALIEQRCGKEVIVPDVTKDLAEISRMCLVRCQDRSKIDRSRSVTPPSGRRDVRISCPGENCFEGNRHRWFCRNCRTPVAYGVTDEYFYCQCSRYLSNDAEFRCNGTKHGQAYARYSEKHLREQLKVMPVEDEYNILLMGQTGVGKSMFINALLNYLMFDTLRDALDDKGPLRYQIPCSFAFQDQERNDHKVVVGKASKWEVLTKMGHSATQSATTYCFRLEGKLFRLIDTPGVGDTEGKDRDRKNTENILRMLKKVGKLNAILYLLPANTTRADESFKACMSDILCHLHRDMATRILFGFTNAHGMNYTLGATSGPLDGMLKTLQTGISRGPLNQFFFDSMGFMYLAACKQTHISMAGGSEPYEFAWEKSSKEVNRLFERIYSDYESAQDVNTTLKLNWADNFLSGMAMPLSVFAESMRKTEKDWETLERKWTEKGISAENLKDLNIKLIVPVRYDLPSKRMVCCHPDCTTQVKGTDGGLETKYDRICHDNCTQNAPEGQKGHPEVQYCNPFRRWLFFCGYECRQQNCKHPWQEHMKISYELRIEERPASDTDIHQIRDLQDKRAAIRQEREQVQASLVLFQVYLNRNVLGKAEVYRDATVSYLDRSIRDARRNGRPDEERALERQKVEHTDAVKAFEKAIDSGEKAIPEEQAVDEAVKKMKEMKQFGEYVRKAVDEAPTRLEDRPFIWVDVKLSANKKRLFSWSLFSDIFGEEDAIAFG